MPIVPRLDPDNPGQYIWVDSVTGEPATQPGGPGTAFVAPSDLPGATPAAGAPAAAAAPASPAGGINAIPSALGHPDWTVVPDSLQKAQPKLVDNPRAGLTKPDGTKEPPQISQDTGRWQVVLATPEGVNRLVELTPGTMPAGKTPDSPGVDPSTDVNWQPASAPADVPERAGKEETNARVATANATSETAKANAQIAQSNLEKVQRDNAEMAANAAAGKGFITNEDLRKIEQDAATNNLTQQQINARTQEIENNNKNSARSNEIAATNANTAAANQVSTAEATTARVKYEEGQLDLANAQFEHTKSQDEIAQRNAETKIKLDQLQQQQANEIAQQTLEQRRVEGKETASSNAATLAQRKAEQDAAAAQAKATLEGQQQQTATQAATSVYGTERQAQTAAGTVGGNLLSNRATAANNLLNGILGGAAGLSQGSAGRYGMLGGGLHAMPAGFDATQMLQGIQGYTAGEFGGQDTLNAAAAMVRGAAPGAELTPQGQAAIGVIQQAFERQHQLSGQPAPQVAAAAAARQTATNGGMAAPTSAPVTAQVPPVAAQPVLSNPLGRVPESAADSMARNGFSAPQTSGATPTIVMNF
jgi:chemotaxis protein histidine kinase CheA